MTRRYVQLGVALAACAGIALVLGTTARGEPGVSAITASASSNAMIAARANEVPFDHTIHAGTYKIPCLDCHVYADKAPSAGLPSGRKCIGCHKFVAKDKPAIQKLAERVAAGQSLVWLRVFAVPDFIYFSHRMHVRAQVACAECHGDIASETAVTQERPFTMGRCITCHAERHAVRDCLGCHK